MPNEKIPAAHPSCRGPEPIWLVYLEGWMD
jgi:hypothetical protein